MDDKQPFVAGPRPDASRTRRRRAFHWLTLTALGALALTYRHAFDGRSSPGRLAVSGCGMSVGEDPARIWEKIVPSTNLSWTPCYENKECAKLAVPIDYADPSGPQAAIALLKVPSKVPAGQPGYRGPILFNPGGPGGSGVQYVLGRGEQFRAILGEDYDLIGFDPRGIGFTQPKMEVFTNPVEKASWELRTESATLPPVRAMTNDTLSRDAAQWAVFGDLATRRLSYSGQYVSTALVSRDMLRITEAHGFEKIKYWGFSYGSVLGITFAAMFPDKVDRLIVDGVCDTYNYYETQWSNNLRDTDAGLRLFYEACVEAGPEACALHKETADEVQARTENIFAALKERPLAVFAPTNSTSQNEYGLVDYATARHTVFQYLYGPYGSRGTNASTIAVALAAAEDRNGRPLFDLAKSKKAELKCDCGNNDAQKDLAGRESTLAIACSDGDVVDDSVEELQAHLKKMAKFSSFAELWSVRVQCSGWKIRAKERFTGPFVGNTSFPIMLIGNSADPVTPLWNARKMASGFKNAAVLHQKSAGHCSLAAASLCTAKTVRDYFRHGVLPEEGKECDIESRMFGEPVKALGLSEEDQQLTDAITELSRDFEPPMLHL